MPSSSRNLSEVLANQRSEIIQLNAELAMKNEKIASLEKEVQEKDFLISSLQHEKTFSPQRKFVSREDDLEH